MPLPKPIECVGCPLWEEDQSGFIRPEGHGTLGVLMMGEAGGQHERYAGLPFRPKAPAGSVLESAIKLAGFSRDQFRVANTVNCTPPRDWIVGAPWEFGAIQHCEQHRARIIEEMKPRVILALGGIAFRTLTGHDGPSQGISLMRGYPIDTPHGLVLGTYHPSFLIRGNMNLRGVLMTDIQRAVGLARTGFHPKPVEYCMKPSLDDMGEFLADARAHPELPLAFDIETDQTVKLDEETYGEDHTPILSIQFSLRPQTGIFVTWVESVLPWVKELLGLPNDLVGHNSWKFDLPKLRAAGVRPPRMGFDTMEAFRHLQRDLSGHYNLQSVGSFYGMDFPWKHLAQSDGEFYGCADVDAVQRIWARLPVDLKTRGIW